MRVRVQMLPSLNLLSAKTEGRTAPFKSAGKSVIFKGLLKVGGSWNFLPNTITYKDSKYFLVESELLEIDAVDFVNLIFPTAVPVGVSVSTDVFVFVSRTSKFFNTLVLVTSGRASEKTLFSISRLRTHGTNEIDKSTDPAILDHMNYRSELLAKKNELIAQMEASNLEYKLENTELLKKLNETERLRKAPTIVLKAEIERSDADRDFLRESEPRKEVVLPDDRRSLKRADAPPSVVANPRAAAKPRPSGKQPIAPPSVVANPRAAAKPRPSGKQPIAPLPEVVHEMDDSDSDGDGGRPSFVRTFQNDDDSDSSDFMQS